jgi:hypothetical protein
MAAIPIALPKNLPTLVASTFATAKKANKLSYFPTEVAILNLNGIPVCYAAEIAHTDRGGIMS